MFGFSSPRTRQNETRSRRLRPSQLNSRSLRFENLEERRVMTAVPYGAAPEDLGEFLLGSVAVTPVFFESNGQLDPDTETWTDEHKAEVLGNINEGLTWWVDTLDSLNTVHELQFTVDETFVDTPASTRYEPISRISNDYRFYVGEFLNSQGYNSGSLEVDMRDFNHAQRLEHNTNWSFTMIVVPSLNDSDGFFASGGSFRRAFAFAGGLFMVVPSTRPASTFAHELGHIFWARDEYAGGGSYFDRRGYYNTQNLNAHDNPTPGFTQETSIMASGSLLTDAYDQNVSPESTLAFLGWQDSDQDGVFDVLDVPHRLSGEGFWNSPTGTYRFQGEAEVQTLPNHNPAGIGNDITINQIDQIQFRFDSGAWQTHSSPETYRTALNLDFNVPVGATTIEIRAIDTSTGVTSNVFTGELSRANSTEVPGINGYAWIDSNRNELRDLAEYGQEFWTVELVDSAGQALDLKTVVEPDDFSDGQITNGTIPGLTLTTSGSDGDGRVGVFVDSTNSTGNKNFRGFSKSARSYVSNWNSGTRKLQVDFGTPQTRVQIDAVGALNNSIGRLEAYSLDGELLDRYTTKILEFGEVETMVVERPEGDIAYVIAGGHAHTSVKLDNLQIGVDSSTLTGPRGGYTFPSVPAGNYNVRVTPASGFATLDPISGQQEVLVQPGVVHSDVDFAFAVATSDWQNPENRFDVNADTSVSALDALLIINELNTNGPRDLLTEVGSPPPYLDVSGDLFVSALDVLQVINFLNSGSGEGEENGVRFVPQDGDNPNNSDVYGPAFFDSGDIGQSLVDSDVDEEEEELLALLALGRPEFGGFSS